MRKFLSVIVIVLLSETLYAQGQMAALIHLNANVFECGSLRYKDGRVEEYKFVSIPRANMASIAVSNESKTKGIKEVDVNENLFLSRFGTRNSPRKRLPYIT